MRELSERTERPAVTPAQAPPRALQPEAQAAPKQSAPGRPAHTSNRRLTPVKEVLEQAAAALRARAKSRDIALRLDVDSERRVRHAGTLRECFLVLLADTLDTTHHGSLVRVRLRDLAGGRVELLIIDDAREAELVERALQKRDGSGRARSLARVFERLANEHQARWVSDVGPDGRRLLVDIGFPSEAE